MYKVSDPDSQRIMALINPALCVAIQGQELMYIRYLYGLARFRVSKEYVCMLNLLS